jgi:hypothetical protein
MPLARIPASSIGLVPLTALQANQIILAFIKSLVPVEGPEILV